MVNRSRRSRRPGGHPPGPGNENEEVSAGYGNQPNDADKNQPHVLTPFESIGFPRLLRDAEPTRRLLMGRKCITGESDLRKAVSTVAL